MHVIIAGIHSIVYSVRIKFTKYKSELCIHTATVAYIGDCTLIEFPQS